MVSRHRGQGMMPWACSAASLRSVGGSAGGLHPLLPLRGRAARNRGWARRTWVLKVMCFSKSKVVAKACR